MTQIAKYDVVIRNGMIVDGTRGPRYIGDVGIKDGVIAKIGRISAADGTKILDAEGLIVAPGFIDLHTHYDAQIYWDPYCTLSGWHGVTSVAIGNCGFGFAPVKPELRDRSMLSMTRVEAIPLKSMQEGMPWDWVTFPEFLNSLDQIPKAVNVLPYMPVNPLLIWVLGFEDAKAGRMPTDTEHAEIRRLLDEAMDAGACGWSAQRLNPDGPASAQRDFDGTPMCSDVMHDETCIELAKVLAKRNEGFMQMTLFSGSRAHDEAHYETLAAVSGRPILYNVVQAFDDRPYVHRKTLAWLQQCRERGLRIYGQGQTTDAGFTFTFEDWNLFDDSPSWREATTGTISERLQKLADPARRSGLTDQETIPDSVIGPFETITVLTTFTAETAKYADHFLGEIATKQGKHVIDAMLDIAVADGLRTVFYANSPNKSLVHLKEIVDSEYVLFGISDGGAHTKFSTAGRFPTETLINVVRENKMISLEEAHWRMAALPAQFAGFHNRGVLREGAPADIIVYDFDNLAMTAMEVAYDLPANEWRRIQRAKGYRWVLVNGQVTIENDTQTNVYSGQLLRHGARAVA